MKKLTLHIIEKDKDWKEIVSEFDHDMEVNIDEYDFILRMLRKSREFHGSIQDLRYQQIRLLSRHAPELGHKVFKTVGYHGCWFCQWDEQVIKDSQYREEDLESDDECEVLLATFCGDVITEKNNIGCYYRRDFIYDTCPDASFGVSDRRGFDAIDCDIFGCDLNYWNDKADVANRKLGAFKFLGTTFSVEYLDELRNYKIQSKRYDQDVYEPVELARAMQHSLRIIHKKILRRELDRII